MNTFGKVLVKGTGNGSNAILGWIAFYGAGAIFMFVMAFTVGTVEVPIGWMGRTETVRTEFFYIFIAIAIIELVFAVLIANAISETEITVYENGIAGQGISKWFYFGDVRRFTFMLTFDQVSVDLNGSQLVIHGPGTHYKVYVDNSSEIQQIIFNIKNKPSTLVSADDMFCPVCKYRLAETNNAAFCPGCGTKIMIPPVAVDSVQNTEEPINSDICINDKTELFIQCRGCKSKYYDTDSTVCPHCWYLSNTAADIKWECNKCSTINLRTNNICNNCGCRRA